MQAVSRIPQLTPLSLPHSYTPVLSDATHVQDTHGLPPGLLRVPRPDGRPSPPEAARPVVPRPSPAIRPPPSPLPLLKICGTLQSAPGSTPPFPPSYPGFPHFFLKERPLTLYMSYVYISSRPETKHRIQLYTTMAHTATTLKPPPP